MKPANYTEHELIQRFNKGEHQALSEMYGKWFSALRYYAFRLTKSMAEAEDITVSALQELFSRHANFESMPQIKKFLYKTVKNKSIKHIQSREKEKSTHQIHYDLTGDTADYVLSQMVKAELMREIAHEIGCLPQKRREVFTLFYLEGLNVQEIAKRLNMTPGAVSHNKHKAIEQLRLFVLNKKLLPVTGAILFALKLAIYNF